MGWTVILLPDAAGEAAARRVWQAVSRGGFPSDLYDGESKPHISLTVLERQDGTLEAASERFAVTAAPVTATLATIGSFGEDVIYLSPQPQAALLRMNRDLTAAIGPLAAMTARHYLPGVYVPHMTVAFDVPEGDFPRVHRLVRGSFVPFTATFSTIAVVKFHPVKVVATFALAGKGV